MEDLKVTNENNNICSNCGGKCCKNMGCHFSPEDFADISYEGLKKEIDKGCISIDWWEGNPFKENDDRGRAYYLRIRNVNAPIVNPSYGGICCLLTSSGCSLKYEDRPKGARMLIPSNDICIDKYSKQQSAQDWFKYKDTLQELVDTYKVGIDQIAELGYIIETLNFLSKTSDKEDE